jgi:hypothetical protein
MKQLSINPTHYSQRRNSVQAFFTQEEDFCTLGSDFHTSVQKRPFYTLVCKIGGQCAKIFSHWPPSTMGLHGQLSERVCKFCAHNPFFFAHWLLHTRAANSLRGKLATFFNPKNLEFIDTIKVRAGGFRPQNIVFMSHATLFLWLIKFSKNLIPSNSWWQFGWLPQSRNPTRDCTVNTYNGKPLTLSPTATS